MCTNSKDKKWMLKSYIGKKILQILKKTTVAFMLVESSIYHCFFFLDPLLGKSDGNLVWP